jgi:hypothetical protein
MGVTELTGVGVTPEVTGVTEATEEEIAEETVVVKVSPLEVVRVDALESIIIFYNLFYIQF